MRNWYMKKQGEIGIKNMREGWRVRGEIGMEEGIWGRNQEKDGKGDCEKLLQEKEIEEKQV